METATLTSLTEACSLGSRWISDNSLAASSIYNRLDRGSHQIRLVRVFPGTNGKELVHCRMQTFDLGNNPRYVALSYTWGLEADHRILLDDKDFVVRKNLWRFLRQVRALPVFEAIWFWIDAICINQGQASERTHQVNLMPQIYKNAYKVLVWLGPAYAESDQILAALSRPARFWKDGSKTLWIWSAPPGRAISNLCSRPYWRRLWIFQELMLAQRIDLMCGDLVFDWEPFKELLMATPITVRERLDSRLSDNMWYNTVTDSAAASIVRQIEQKSTQHLLFDLVRTTARLRCSDPLDKIYGLLGLATAGHSGIIADYSASTQELANCVLRKHHQVHPPETCAEIWEQCHVLEKALMSGKGSIFALDDSQDEMSDCLDFLEPPLFPIDPTLFPGGTSRDKICLKTLSWAVLHNHRYVARCFVREMEAKDPFRYYLDRWVRYGNEKFIEFFLHGDPCIVELEAEALQGAIEVASEIGHEAVLRISVDSVNVDARVKERIFTQALLTAVKRENVAMVKSLLATGTAFMCGGDENGNTALHMAAAMGQDEVARLLITIGEADVDVRNIFGHTPLYRAAESGLLSTCESLINHGGADPRISSRAGLTALHTASDKGHKLVVKLLLESDKSVVNMKNLLGQTALHLASQGASISIMYNGHNRSFSNEDGEAYMTIVNILLGVGKAEINIQDARGMTALHYAAQHGCQTVCRELLTLGQADPNIRDTSGFTALDVASSREFYDVVELLRSVTDNSIA